MHRSHYRPSVTANDRRRRLLGERDGYACRYCGHPLADPATAIGVMPVPGDNEDGLAYRAAPGFRWPQIDHVVPRSRGGSNALANLVLACGPCNVAKGTMTLAEFMAVTP